MLAWPSARAAWFEAYLLRAGHGLRDVSRENREVIERRELVFSLALIALGTETLMWTLALALPDCYGRSTYTRPQPDLRAT
jgi:hypothetical protein